MTIERTPESEQDPDATARMPAILPHIDEELEDFDPEKTLVREDPPRSASANGGANAVANEAANDVAGNVDDDVDWETAVIRRIAPHVAAVREQVEQDEECFGWESDSLRRLSQALK